ncbi:sigma-54-dependent transcriptional regulator [Candidatus Riflebacteria bacterium]
MSENLFPKRPVLLVDDNADLLQSLKVTLLSSGINNIILCDNSKEVIPIIASTDMELIVLDILMPDLNGEDILKHIVEEYPGLPVVMLTAVQEVETAVRCIKLGAFDYLTKPLEKSRFISVIKRLIELRLLQRENSSLKERLFSGKINNPEIFRHIITRNNNMHSIFQYVETIAPTNRPVLITGETGAGKELIARAIHELSGCKGNFIPINIAGLDDTVFADTLFGHKKGAYTGADEKRDGLLFKAAGGTFFLDEIGDLPEQSQIKLLRLIQEKEFLPIGSDIPRKSDARVLVATHKNVEEMLKNGRFRKDLYFRLNTHRIDIPPLRERLDDLPLLVDHFLKEAAISLGKKPPTIPPELFTILSVCDFPGNVRELQNMLLDAVSRHHKGILSLDPFKKALEMNVDINSITVQGVKKDGRPHIDFEALFSHKFPTLKEVELMLIEEAMLRSKGNQSVAAKILGVSRSTLNKRLKQFKDLGNNPE